MATSLLAFPAPGSATGEDVIELHLPGSPPLVNEVLQGLHRAGVRLAEPGEFTRRAFLNGRLDLVQAEAVLGLIESLDQLLNLFEGALWAFSIEKPDIPKEYHNDFETLTDLAVQSVECLVLASRAFFRNIEAVGDHNHKVMFFEKEADKVSTKLKKSIFGSDLDLSQKTHLRNFVEHIDNVPDWAEDVADRLAIYAIKRTV